MITSLVGKLFKAPEVNSRIEIAGKTVIDFTLVENRKRGADKKIATFYNLTMITSSDKQKEMILGFGKGTVLAFSGVRVNFVKGGEMDSPEVKNNISADVQSFEIISSVDDVSGEGTASGPSYSRPVPSPQNNRRGTPPRPAMANAPIDKDPFESDEPSPFDS